MGIKTTLFFFFFFVTARLLAQQHVMLLSGLVVDENNQPLSFVSICERGSHVATTTGANGYFRMVIPLKERLDLVFTSVGYMPVHFYKNSDGRRLYEVNMVLKKYVAEIPEIQITDQSARNQGYLMLNPQLSLATPSPTEGIASLLKTLPGVASNNELSNQLAVRGGNYDENLNYINDIEIYRPFLVQQGNEEGLSAPNASMVGTLKFSPGAFGAEYGDKMSSVTDIQYRVPKANLRTVSLGILSSGLTVEGTAGNGRLKYVFGLRERSNGYLLKSKGNQESYKPLFIDAQSFLSFSLTKQFSLSSLTILSRNQYNFYPQTQVTAFGTLSSGLQLNAVLLGKEDDRFASVLQGLTLRYHPTDRVTLKLIGSFYADKESIARDITGYYSIAKTDATGATATDTTAKSAVGYYQDIANNFLSLHVISLEQKGTVALRKNEINWALRVASERISNKIYGYEIADSLRLYDYTTPPYRLDSMRAGHLLYTRQASAYLQGVAQPFNRVSVTAGVRVSYLDISKQWMASPRFVVAYQPNPSRDLIFKLSGGVYYQPPFYNELFEYTGKLATNLRAQKSYQGVLTSDYRFKTTNFPLSWVTEVYYKYLASIIPYEIKDVNLLYFANQRTTGYSKGLNMRLNGQFVKDLESSISVSLQKTQEKGWDAAGRTEYIPRPTDQRINVSVFFQDKLKSDPTLKTYLFLTYGSPLPIGPPNFTRYKDVIRVPAYRRVDIGFSKSFFSNAVTVYAEVFNILNINNTISYLWLTDLSGTQYAVPRYLTQRQFNLKLIASF